MKKIIIALMLCLTLCISMMAVGCNDTKDPDDTKDPGTSDPGTTDPGTQDPGNDKNEDDNKEDETPAKVTYKVIIKDAAGNGVKDVEIQICVDGSCKLPKATKEDGTAEYTMNAPAETSKVELQINEVPAGFKLPEGKIAITAGQTEITVVLEAAA